MRKILYLFVFIAATCSTLPGQEALTWEYNMQAGDEYFFKLETNAPSGTAYEAFKATYLISVQVLEVRQDDYLMAMKYVWIYQQKGDAVFRTHSYYPGKGLEFIELVQRLAIDQPIHFTLGKTGKISDIFLSEPLNTSLKSHIVGIEQKRNLRTMSILAKSQIRTVIRHIFPKLAEKADAKDWVETIPAGPLAPELQLDYWLQDTTNSEYIVSIEQSYDNEDQVVLSTGGIYETIPQKIEHMGGFILDKNTRLTIGAAIIKKTTHIFRFISDPTKTITQKSQVTVKVGRLDKINMGEETIISGRLPEFNTWHQIRFRLGYDFPDRDLLDLKITPDGKSFFARVLLERPTELSMVAESSTGRPYNYGNILLEPGDSLYIDLEPRDFALFSGKGAEKNNLWQSIRQAGLNLSPGMSLQDVNKTGKSNKKERDALLESGKKEISRWAYNHLKTDIYFREQRNRFNYYLSSTRGSISPGLFQQLFGDLDFDTYSSSQSFEFRWFIKDYLTTQAHIIHGYKEQVPIKNSELYTLANMLLDGEQEYYAKAFLVLDAMKLGHINRYESIYQEFSNTYPGSSLLKTLKSNYERRGNVALGKVAPDFSLQSLEGETVNIRDFRGKWVMLAFCDLTEETYDKYLDHFSKMADDLPEDHFQLIVAFTHENEQLTRDFLAENKLNALYLDNHGWKNNGTLPYNLPIISNNFLINPEGEFEFLGGLNSWERYLTEFKEYIIFDMAERAAMEGSTSNDPPLWLLLLGLVLLLLIWLYFKFKTALIKRREREKLEKVELEIKAVRSQLNPHFLFNSMSSIQHLVNANANEKANIFLSKFANLMRKVLNQADLQLQSLSQELETLTDYLDLEALRHGFTYHIAIEEGVDVHNTDIPPMLLQPFVENAVVHGISQVKEHGHIDIQITPAHDEAISIKILDNGVGLRQESLNPQSNGKGLDLTRRRIGLLMEKFKNEISFILKDRQDFDGQRGAFAEIVVGLEN